MKIRDLRTGLARRLGGKTAKATAKYCSAAILAGGILFAGAAIADTIGFDDFEGLTMEPFTAANAPVDLGFGGLDWTKDIRVGTAREWTVDNSGMSGTTSSPAYDGWSAWNVESWIAEQGVQLGRGTGVVATANTALVADPDAWDDFTSGAGTGGYNSYIQRSYDLTGSGADRNLMEISFDYEFAPYANQRGTVEVSFDGGGTYSTLLDLDSTVIGNSVLTTGPVTFTAGVDFTPTADTMILRIGCLNGGNDWWFALDNISVSTTDTLFNDFEDFEGLTLDQFGFTIGDGTDFTQSIPGWTIDNSGNNDGLFPIVSMEPAYDGFSAIDVMSWGDEQGGGRTIFNITDPNNTVLMCDGDAFDDFADPAPGAPLYVNSYITREYDITTFDASTIAISFEYEFRVYDSQTGVAEVSFDGGLSWQRLLELDENDGAPSDFIIDLASYNAGVDFTATQSSSMLLRFGYLEADDDWWFAIDNVLVEGDVLTGGPVFPDTFTIVNGVSNGGGLQELLTSDNNDARISRDPFSLQPRVVYEVEATSLQANPSTMDFTIEESVFARGDVSRTIEMFNYDTSQFEQVDLRNSSRLGDRTDVISLSGNLGRFVENGTNRVRARLRYDGPIPRAAFTCNTDNIFWTIN